jgi:hypothetical protein
MADIEISPEFELTLHFMGGRGNSPGEIFYLLIEKYYLCTKLRTRIDLPILMRDAIEKHPHGVAREIRNAPCPYHRAQSHESGILFFRESNTDHPITAAQNCHFKSAGGRIQGAPSSGDGREENVDRNCSYSTRGR